jgi:hypothetical protein
LHPASSRSAGVVVADGHGHQRGDARHLGPGRLAAGRVGPRADEVDNDGLVQAQGGEECSSTKRACIQPWAL